MNAEGEMLRCVRIPSQPAELAEAMAEAGEAPEVVLESTYGWYWAAELLQELGANVHLAHPLGDNWGHRRVKNDERDAKVTGKRWGCLHLNHGNNQRGPCLNQRDGVDLDSHGCRRPGIFALTGVGLAATGRLGLAEATPEPSSSGSATTRDSATTRRGRPRMSTHRPLLLTARTSSRLRPQGPIRDEREDSCTS